MGEKSNEIERNIEQTRAELGSNLQALEEKVKGAADWRRQFDKSPLTMIGLAFGGGMLLAAAVGGRSRLSYADRHGNGFSSPKIEGAFKESEKATASQLRRASNTWDTIKGALIGVAAGKVQTLLKEAVPGFREEFRRVQRREHPEAETPDVQA